MQRSTSDVHARPARAAGSHSATSANTGVDPNGGQDTPTGVDAPAWQGLPPIQRTVTGEPRLNEPGEFSGSLAAWRDPSFLAPLGHAVGAYEPSGVLHGVAVPLPAPTTSTEGGAGSAAPLAGQPSGGPATPPATVQRLAASEPAGPLAVPARTGSAVGGRVPRTSVSAEPLVVNRLVTAPEPPLTLHLSAIPSEWAVSAESTPVTDLPGRPERPSLADAAPTLGTGPDEGPAVAAPVEAGAAPAMSGAATDAGPVGPVLTSTITPSDVVQRWGLGEPYSGTAPANPEAGTDPAARTAPLVGAATPAQAEPAGPYPSGSPAAQRATDGLPVPRADDGPVVQRSPEGATAGGPTSMPLPTSPRRLGLGEPIIPSSVQRFGPDPTAAAASTRFADPEPASPPQVTATPESAPTPVDQQATPTPESTVASQPAAVDASWEGGAPQAGLVGGDVTVSRLTELTEPGAAEPTEGDRPVPELALAGFPRPGSEPVETSHLARPADTGGDAPLLGAGHSPSVAGSGPIDSAPHSGGSNSGASSDNGGHGAAAALPLVVARLVGDRPIELLPRDGRSATSPYLPQPVAPSVQRVRWERDDPAAPGRHESHPTAPSTATPAPGRNGQAATQPEMVQRWAGKQPVPVQRWAGASGGPAGAGKPAGPATSTGAVAVAGTPLAVRPTPPVVAQTYGPGGPSPQLPAWSAGPAGTGAGRAGEQPLAVSVLTAQQPTAGGDVRFVQRVDVASAEPPPPPPPTAPPGGMSEPEPTPTPGGSGTTAAPAAPGAGSGGGTEPEELLKKLFDPLLRRLKTELRLDHERHGVQSGPG